MCPIITSEIEEQNAATTTLSASNMLANSQSLLYILKKTKIRKLTGNQYPRMRTVFSKVPLGKAEKSITKRTKTLR